MRTLVTWIYPGKAVLRMATADSDEWMRDTTGDYEDDTVAERVWLRTESERSDGTVAQ